MLEHMIKRTSIELDSEKLANVQRILGTKGLKDTVERAFDEIIRAELRRRLFERLRTGEGIDTGPEMLEQIRPRPIR